MLIFLVKKIFQTSIFQLNLPQALMFPRRQTVVGGGENPPSNNGLAAWEQSALTFYDSSDGVISPTITESDLQLLGDLIGRSSFDSASVMFNISTSHLQTIRQLYYATYTQYYYRDSTPELNRTYGDPIIGKVKKIKGKKYSGFKLLPECEEEFRICKEQARLTFLERSAACVGAGLTAGAAITPIGGFLVGIGCQLITGRKMTNELRLCQINYNRCGN